MFKNLILVDTDSREFCLVSDVLHKKQVEDKEKDFPLPVTMSKSLLEEESCVIQQRIRYYVDIYIVIGKNIDDKTI